MHKNKLFIIFAICIVVFSFCSSSWAEYYDEGHFGASEADAYIIDSISDLVTLRNRVNSGTEPEGLYYKLTVNPNLTEYTDWVPIGTDNDFKGHFDGDGHTVSLNVTNRGGNTAGLFGTISTSNEDYAVKNLTVTGTVYGQYVGGIAVTLNSGTIENCTVTSGTLESYIGFTGSWSGVIYDVTGSYVGGIIRYMASGLIKNCTVSKMTISGHSHYTTYNAEFSTNYAGGIVAYMAGGNVENCTVESDSSIEAYSTTAGYDNNSSLTRPSFAGGIVGYASLAVDETIKDCKFSGTVWSSGKAGGITT